MSFEDTTQIYAQHVADVSVTNKAIAAEDIYNAAGALVVAKNFEINHAVAKRLAQHKLRKPLESSIKLDRSLDHQSSLNLLSQRLESLELQDILSLQLHKAKAQQALVNLTSYPLILQKLTIMSHQLPIQFMRSLLCATFSLGICHELKLDSDTTERVFLANLLADIGLLHINPEVVKKAGKYTAEEWQLMKGHVIIAKHIVDLEPKLDRRVGRAILEHHERIDGYGYPFGKKAQELCQESQIVAIADTVSALYRKLVLHGNHSEMAVLAVFELPTSAHSGGYRNAVIRMLKRATIPYRCAFTSAEIPELIARLIAKRQHLNLWLKRSLEIYLQYEKPLNAAQDMASVALAKQLTNTIGSTGLLSSVQHRWLSTMDANLQPQAMMELEEYALKIDELEYQCHFIMRKLRGELKLFARQIGSAELASAYLLELSQLLGPAPEPAEAL